jgi:large conductance mechanosensitive channel
MKKLWTDFKAFIKRGNAVDMAVGVAVAAAFTAIVTSITKGFISPLLALLTNNSDLASMKTVVREAILNEAGEVVQAEVAILWGAFLQAVIDFFIIALVLFLALRIVSAINAHAEKIAIGVKNKFSSEDEVAAAEAEAAAKAAAEAEAAAAKAAEEAALAIENEKRAESDRLARQEALLTEIRDLLKNKQ